MKKFPTKDDLIPLLQASIDRFNDSIDRKTLLAATDLALEQRTSRFRVAHEQAVSHRLAYYLENSLRDDGLIADAGPVAVDCEYNQHLFDRKRLRVLMDEAESFLAAERVAMPIEGRRDAVEFEIRPDILVHERGRDGPNNLLVLEVKRWSNPDRAHDALKLELLTRPGLNTYVYELGAAVYIRDDFKVQERVLELGVRFHAGTPC